MLSDSFPPYFEQCSAGHALRFSCHPGVPCFTECCRELDLALTPYDALRLRRFLKLSSGAFLDQYVIIEWDEQLVFPACYLTMVDDGRASCVFLQPAGCSVYADRPGSCRAYPVGRGASAGETTIPIESLVLIREPHCKGFDEAAEQTVASYLLHQGIDQYNRFNDELLPLLHHTSIREQRFRPARRQLDQYILALYDLDQFRRDMNEGRIAMQRPLSPAQLSGLTGNEEELLLLGIRWLMQEWFNE